ncbi:hypothetical protein FUAX_28510 [Fulvitalea axinellae]|uniref:Stage II sporulation protein M n=1 Tax=Fulvitalea axinellae TaxID=1182444 RepID=A0AAU9CVA4_9BACT|nr:hypothetical protein FUAX_28510 [Fulvitalea axinellae]
MKESNFIKNNTDKWQTLEDHINTKDQDPDKLSKSFIQITDDLSFSRTYYKHRSIRLYLNSLSKKLFSGIYRQRGLKWKAVADFWKEELPLISYHSRKEYLVSLVVFLLAVLVGVFSTIQEPEFTRQILGDRYVDMTLRNIEKGDPAAVYKDSDAVGMAIRIGANNLKVTVLTYASGLFAALGCIFVLIGNGVMLGTFQTMFYNEGVLGESFLAIWQHGAVEISSIVIAGGAGLVLGKGLIFPGTYSRGQALRIGALRSVKILMGLIPLIVFAAIVESFITRLTDVPDILRALSIAISFGFMYFYFVWYPKKVYVSLGEEADRAEEIPYREEKPPRLGDLLTAGECLSETIRWASSRIGKVLAGILPAAIAGAVLVQVFGDDSVMLMDIKGDPIGLFSPLQVNIPATVRASVIFLLVASALWSYCRTLSSLRNGAPFFKEFLRVSPFAVTLALPFFLPHVSLSWLLFGLQFFSVSIIVAHILRKQKGEAFKLAFRLVRSNIGKILGALTLVGIINLLLYMLITTPAFGLQAYLFGYLISDDFAYKAQLTAGLMHAIKFMVVGLGIYLALSQNLFCYHSIKERYTSCDLLRRLEGLGTRKSYRGIAREN